MKHNAIHYIVTILNIFLKGVLSSLIWFFVGVGGAVIWFKSNTPYNLIFGLPLILVSIGLIFNNFHSFFLSLFSKTYNKGVCEICHP